MASITKLPKKITQQHQIKPRGAQRPNPARAINDREFRRKLQAEAAANAAASPPPSAPSITAASSSRGQCQNKACKFPNVVDGVCRSCGRVADDSNIVAEIQFGETSSGAAVVQGSFLGADQAGPRPMGGPAYRRIAGGGSGEARDRNLREAKQMMDGFVVQLNISPQLASIGAQIYRSAVSMNFVQGRGIQKVVVVCLYAACRKETPCKVMLIDLADLIKADVFVLGRYFKALMLINPAARDRVQPIFAEDLIFRFAVKLEFGEKTTEIATAAVRLVQRMDRDWMVMGRKPSGICGCALIIAARMHNYRRTPLEVAYIAKVTMVTITQRLDEFRHLPSADMSVEEFYGSDFLEHQHDPPSFYKKTEEYKAMAEGMKKPRKRKRRAEEDLEADRESSAAADSPDNNQLLDDGSNSPTVPVAPTAQAAPITDADGFVIPALPRNSAQETASEERQYENTMRQLSETSDQQLGDLARAYGDQSAVAIVGDAADAASPGSVSSPQSSSAGTPRKKRYRTPGSSVRSLPPIQGYGGPEWEQDEEAIADDISGNLESVSDPDTVEHLLAFASAQERARVMAEAAEEKAKALLPTRAHIYQNKDLDAPEVNEWEFDNDPEIENCLLSERERKIKEMVWLNENKDWLKKQQEKAYRAKMAPPKKTRKRAKKARIGEGQTSPASTAGEAAAQALQRHAMSKRLDYNALKNMLDSNDHRGPGSIIGSEVTSRQTSRAGSSVGDDDDDDAASDSEPEQSQTGDNDQDEDVEEGGYDEEEGGEEIDPFADDDQGAAEDDE